MYYFNNSALKDPTYSNWQNVLTGVIVQSLGIITSCIPYLKPLLESLESGMIRIDDLRRKGGSSYADNSTSGQSHRLGRLNFGSKAMSKPVSATGGKSVVNLGYGQTDVSVSGGRAVTQEFDRESQRSNVKMIRETKTWNIESE